MTGKTDAERLAVVETKLDTIIKQLGEFAKDQATAGESRKRQYESQEKMSREMLDISYRLQTVEKQVEAFAPTSREYEQMRDRAIGAGTLGRWLWRIGGLLISAAAGAAAAWTTLTGRPPP